MGLHWFLLNISENTHCLDKCSLVVLLLCLQMWERCTVHETRLLYSKHERSKQIYWLQWWMLCYFVRYMSHTFCIAYQFAHRSLKSRSHFQNWLGNILNCFCLILKLLFIVIGLVQRLLSHFEAKQHCIKFSSGKQCNLFANRNIQFSRISPPAWNSVLSLLRNSVLFNCLKEHFWS